MYKGIIMEINRNYCVVFTNNQEFIKLKIKKGIYESQEIYFTQSDIYAPKAYAKWALAAAVILMALVFSGLQINEVYPYMNPHNAAVISIDINPSVEFYVDENNTVTKIYPLNEGARNLVSDHWVGKTFHTALSEYLDNAIDQSYLKQESTILMSCASLDDDFNKETIIKEVNQTIKEKKVSDITYGYIESNKETVKKAKKANVSIGKYEVYDDIKDKKQSLNSIEKVKDMKVSDLIQDAKEVKVIRKGSRNEKRDSEKFTDKDKEKVLEEKPLSVFQEKKLNNKKQEKLFITREKNNKNNKVNERLDQPVKEKKTDEQIKMDKSKQNEKYNKNNKKPPFRNNSYFFKKYDNNKDDKKTFDKKNKKWFDHNDNKNYDDEDFDDEKSFDKDDEDFDDDSDDHDSDDEDKTKKNSSNSSSKYKKRKNNAN